MDSVETVMDFDATQPKVMAAQLRRLWRAGDKVALNGVCHAIERTIYAKRQREVAASLDKTWVD